MQIETPQAVAIYCRLSKEDLDENKIDNLSRSIQNQKSMLTDFAEINGWQIFDIYCDDNLSGVARDRPEFNRLIRDASLRKFNIILCKNQSRFTRDMQLVEKYIHGLFPIWGIRFVGMVDGADTSVKGNKKARQINGLVNEWYLEDMSENIKSSLDDLRRKGHHIGAWVRYGYMKDPNQKGHIIPDPVAAAVVERIFKMYLEGNSRADIARILNSEQIPPPGLYKIQQGDKYKNAFMAGEWDSCSISRILKEEMYIGNMVQGRQASESYKTKKLRTLPKEDWIRVIGTHEAIISLETWNQTQALLAVGARSFTRSEEIGLFSRKVYCGHCNKLMRTGRSKRKSGTYYNYVICVRRHPEINPCPVHAVSNALMEKTILDQLDILAAKYKDGSLFSEIMDEESTIGIEIKRLKAELAQHKKKLVEYESGLKCLYLDKASGSISNSDYQFLSRELSAGKELAERKVDLCTENCARILFASERTHEKYGGDFHRPYRHMFKF